jgi:hypothetical protein
MTDILSAFQSARWYVSVSIAVLVVCIVKYVTAATKKSLVPPAQAHGFERSVKLLYMETTKVAIQLIAVSAITFYEGDVHSELDFVKRKVQEIVKLNPWLLGKLVGHDKEYHLLFNNSYESLRHDTFAYIEDSSLHPKLDGNVIAEKLVQYCVKIAVQCINKDEPLFRVTLFKISDTKLALLFSLSHTLGDGHTFYTLYGMLEVA